MPNLLFFILNCPVGKGYRGPYGLNLYLSPVSNILSFIYLLANFNRYEQRAFKECLDIYCAKIIDLEPFQLEAADYFKWTCSYTDICLARAAGSPLGHQNTSVNGTSMSM